MIMLLMLLVSLATVSAKCDWSKVKLVKSNTCNVYKFEVTGIPDTCFRGNWFVWKQGISGTQPPDSGRIYSHTFKDTGYYYVRVSIINDCCNDDTTIRILIYVTCKPKCDWSKIGFRYNNKCNTYVCELGLIDTCISYTTYIYNFKTLRWAVEDTFRTRIFTKRFTDTGWYRLYVIARNKCGGCDTSYFNFVTVTCQPTSGINEVIKDEPRLIRMYDMLGRPVHNARENEITIYLYSDGSTRKVIKK